MKSALFSAARWAIMAVFLALLAANVVGIARFPAYLPAHIADFNTANSWTPAQTQAALAQLGWPADTLGWVELWRGIVAFNLPALILFLLLWRRANTGYLLFVALVFALWGGGASGAPLRAAGETIPLLAWLDDVFGGLSWQLYFLLLYFFPDGRLVPAWTRWLVAGWTLLMVAGVVSPAFQEANQGPGWLAVYVFFVVAAIGSQVYRYARRSTLEQRKQTRWLVFVLVLAGSYLAVVAPSQFAAPDSDHLGRALIISLVNLLLFSLVFTGPLVVIALSMLRYRLWDIDVVIRRTLIYSAVTALLALVFYGSVVLLQRLFVGISGQQSTVALVASTLAIAALFSPLRRRVQEFIDRRFYRRKYDAAQVLAQFATVARDETDLDVLVDALAQTVREAVQPVNTGVWLQEHDA